MIIYEEQKNDFLISTDPSKLMPGVIHQYLSTQSYWAKNIPADKIIRCIKHSFCFGVYQQSENESLELDQIGFARLITDYTTFAYLADVFIINEFRGKGLSKWLMDFIMHNPEVQGLRRWMLATKDAHGLYKQYGFVPCDKPERLMEIVKPDIYSL